MKPNDPQMLYLILILPSLFGLTLIGDGTVKIIKDQGKGTGFLSIIFGFMFLAAVIFSYLFFSSYFSPGGNVTNGFN